MHTEEKEKMKTVALITGQGRGMLVGDGCGNEKKEEFYSYSFAH